MNPLWSPLINQLEPYTPGEQPRDQAYIKLNTNENPYPPSALVADTLQAFQIEKLSRYPDPQSLELCNALAAHHGLRSDQVFVGNGSDEVLAHAFQAFFRQPAPLLFPDISYSFYPVYCRLYQIDYCQVPLNDRFQINVRDYATNNGGIIIPNPNAPTGIALELEEIRQLLSSHPESAVIIDEAYVDFGARSSIELIDEFANLVVVQTFSKSRSLAGIRLGFAYAQAPLIEALQRVKNSFNSYPIDSLASAVGIATLQDQAHFEACRDRIIQSREQLAQSLAALNFEVFPSASNFLFVRHPQIPAEALYLDLKAKGILVRYFKSPRIDDCLRISIGTEPECTSLIQAIKSSLAVKSRE